MSSALSLLLGPHAAGLLDAAVGEYGAGLTALQVADVHVAPTGGVRVRYVGQVRRADGSLRTEVLVAATGDRIPAGSAVVAGEFDGTVVEVGVWRWQQDPTLPGLAAATHPARLTELLAAGGVVPAAAPRILVRAYRPGQRAVLEVSDGRSRWFVKVVHPAAAIELQYRHALLGAVLPVPRVLVTSADGIIVLPEARGTGMRQVMGTDDHLPTPMALQRVQDALPVELMELPARRSHLQRFEQSLQVLTTITRWDAGEPEQLLSVVQDELLSAAAESGPVVPVHGDFHDGQLLVDDGRVGAVLDIDTAGPGERADEWATMLGHLSVLGLTNPRARSYCAEILAHAECSTDPDSLRLRTAAVIVGLATGPFRTRRWDWRQRTVGRLDLARQWISSMRDHSSAVPVALMSTRDS